MTAPMPWPPSGRQQIGNGTGVLTLRCADESVYNAACLRLFDLGEAPALMRRLGLASGASVTVNYTTLDLLYIITIYLSPAETAGIMHNIMCILGTLNFFRIFLYKNKRIHSAIPSIDNLKLPVL